MKLHGIDAHERVLLKMAPLYNECGTEFWFGSEAPVLGEYTVPKRNLLSTVEAETCGTPPE